MIIYKSVSLANFVLVHLPPAPSKDPRTPAESPRCKEPSLLDAAEAVFSPLSFGRIFVCTKAESFIG